MYIMEAAAIATGEGIMMYRNGWKINAFVKPTNTEECCIVYAYDGSKNKLRKMAVRWNPKAADLVANDWQTVNTMKQGYTRKN